MFHSRPALVATSLIAALAPAVAQVAPVPENVVQLNASAAVEVPQDLLVLQLQAAREGSDPAQVQAQLKAVLDAALAEARKAAQPGALQVGTGNFQVQPRYGRDGRIASWYGSAELLLEGSDFARLGQLAGRLPGMTLASAGFRLSRAAREQAERDAQAQAVAAFRERAGQLAQAFGFRQYTLREVAVQGSEAGPPPRPRMLAMEAKAASADAAVPVEAGRSAVVVTVSGSVQLR